MAIDFSFLFLRSSTTWRSYPIVSRYGRAYWYGWHHYLQTPSWKPRKHRGLCVYSQTKHLKAFWAGYDMAREAHLAGLVKAYRVIDVRYHQGGLY